MAVISRLRRPYQDFTPWPGFGNKQFWEDLLSNPGLAVETVAQYLHLFGLENPSELTSAVAAAVIIVAQWGAASAHYATANDVNKVFNEFKAL